MCRNQPDPAVIERQFFTHYCINSKSVVELEEEIIITSKKLRYLGKSSSNSSEMNTRLTYNFKLDFWVL